MTSIYQSVNERLSKNEKWEYFSMAFKVAISRDEKEVYQGSVWFTDKEYRAESKDLFTLWGNMQDFIAAKKTQLAHSCSSASRFCLLDDVFRDNLHDGPLHKYSDKRLELMK